MISSMQAGVPPNCVLLATLVVGSAVNGAATGVSSYVMQLTGVGVNFCMM